MCKTTRWWWVGLFSVFMFSMMALWTGQALSQEKYPTKPIEIINPFAPGGSTDLWSRIAAGYLNKKWGVPINVVNKPGGNTLPANLQVYRAPLDGLTFLSDSTGSSTMLGIVTKDLPFKIMDRTFIAITGITPSVLIIPSSSPFKTLEDVIADVKRDPGNFTWTSLGGASSRDLSVRQFFKAIGVDYLKTKPVMSQGSAQAVTLTAGGHVKLGSGTPSSVLPAFSAGTVRVIGVTGKSRHPDFPDVPTFEELGYPSVRLETWVGLSGPPKLPSYIVEAWDRGFQEMFKDADVLNKLKNAGVTPYHLDSSKAKGYVMKEMEDIGKLF